MAEVVGQTHLLGPGKPLTRMLASGRLGSLILWGPPGVGKTTIARLLADHLDANPGETAATLAHVPAEFLPKLGAIWAARGQIDPAALGVGVATMIAITALRRAFPRFPGLIVAVGATSAAALALGLGVDTIGSRFGALPDRLPMPALPELGWARVTELLPSALVIAFLAGIESLLSALVADLFILRPTAMYLSSLAQRLTGKSPI